MAKLSMLLITLILLSCNSPKVNNEAQEPLKEISITEFYDGSDSERDLHFNVTSKNEDQSYSHYTIKGTYKGKKLGFVVHIPKTAIANNRIQSGLVLEGIDSLTKNLGDLLSNEFKHTLPAFVNNKATVFYSRNDEYLYYLYYTDNWSASDARLDIDSAKTTIRFSIALIQ